MPHFALRCYQTLQVTDGRLTCVAQCRWAGPQGGKQKRKPKSGWCMLSVKRHINTWLSIISSAVELPRIHVWKLANTFTASQHLWLSIFKSNTDPQIQTVLHLSRLPVGWWWTCVGCSGSHHPREPHRCCTHGYGLNRSSWGGKRYHSLRTPQRGRESETSWRWPANVATCGRTNRNIMKNKDKVICQSLKKHPPVINNYLEKPFQSRLGPLSL